MPIPGASRHALLGRRPVRPRSAAARPRPARPASITSIRVARAGTSDNTVHMAVSTEGYFVDPTAGMQAVTWNPQSTVHPMRRAPNPPAVLNDANIVNLNVDVTVSGATITTDYGGGEALKAIGRSASPPAKTPSRAHRRRWTPPERGGVHDDRRTRPPCPATFTVNGRRLSRTTSLDGGESVRAGPQSSTRTPDSRWRAPRTPASHRGVVHDPDAARSTCTTSVDQVIGLHRQRPRRRRRGTPDEPWVRTSSLRYRVRRFRTGSFARVTKAMWDAGENTQYSSDHTDDGPDGGDTLILGHVPDESSRTSSATGRRRQGHLRIRVCEIRGPIHAPGQGPA